MDVCVLLLRIRVAVFFVACVCVSTLWFWRRVVFHSVKINGRCGSQRTRRTFYVVQVPILYNVFTCEDNEADNKNTRSRKKICELFACAGDRVTERKQMWICSQLLSDSVFISFLLLPVYASPLLNYIKCKTVRMSINQY